MKTKTTTIREIPVEVYQKIVDEAKRQKRSINSQLVIALTVYAQTLQETQKDFAPVQQE